MKKLLILIALILVSCGETKKTTFKNNQTDVAKTYWQQHADYTMDIDMNVNNYQYKGKQKLF